ncbi:MAG: elongation factor P [Acidobacteria bacterium]|nr:elongation factor P [Acidobacteriota bacterium]
MIATSDFKRGARILLDGDPFEIMDYTVQSPSARGSATLVKARVRNVLTRAVFDRTFKSGEKFVEPDLEIRPVQFLYREGDDLHFMDQASYDQFQLAAGGLAGADRYLADGASLRSVSFNGSVVGIELPQFMEFDVADTEPAVRGDTAAGKVMKEAKISTGATVKVPLYIENGERIIVATETGEFVKRAQKP